MVLDRVQRDKPVTLIGAGDVSAEDIETALKFAPHLIAADGGADTAAKLGHAPETVIGDFDSLSGDARTRLPNATFLKDTDQDTTDFEKALTCIDAPAILAVGFGGGRLDHTLAACAILAQRIGPPTLKLGQDDVVVALGKSFSIGLAAGTRVSLFPLMTTRGTSTGLKWPIDDLVLSPLGRLGTSNLATGPVRLTFDREGTLLILPRLSLPQVFEALTSG